MILGRPKAEVDTDELLNLRGAGLSIRKIATQMNLDKMTVCKSLKIYGSEPQQNQAVNF